MTGSTCGAGNTYPARAPDFSSGFYGGKYAGGHLGRDKTYQKCNDSYYWKGMKKDMTSFISNCDACSRTNLGPAKMAPPLNSIPVPAKVWSLIGIDIIGPLPQTSNNNKYIVAATDHFSKWSEASAIPDKSAKSVSKFLLDIICRLGPMDSIITDQGKEFTNSLVDYLTDELDIDHRISSAYHPQTNGQRERDNRTLKEMLTKTTNVNGTDWDTVLQSNLFAYRTSVHASTKVTPFEVMYGRKARIVSTSQPKPMIKDCQFIQTTLDTIHNQRKVLSEIVDSNISKAQERQKKNYDSRHKSLTSYPEGSLVLMKNASKIRRFGCKLAPRWVGPYSVIKTLTKGRVKLQNPSSGKVLANVYHCSHLKLYSAPQMDKQKISLPQKQKIETKRGCAKLKSLPTKLKCATPKKTSNVTTQCSSEEEVFVVSETKHGSSFKPPIQKVCNKICSDMSIKFSGRPAYGRSKAKASEPGEIHSVKGDGNCLFRALSFAISGSEDSYIQCRAQIVKHMRASQITEKLGNYLNQNVDRYLRESRMEKNAIWATDAEILGAASLFNMDVHVFSRNGTNRRGNVKFSWLRYPSSLSSESNTKYGLYLQNLANDHFNVVLDC